MRVFSLLAVLVAATTFAAEPPLDPQEVDFFEKKIRPVLVEHCYKCHSAEAKEVKGGLRLDSRAATLAGGETGPAVVPGNLKQSLLLQALRHDGLEMPPNKKLPAEVLADFERWVTRGAVDPRGGEAPAAPARKEIDWATARDFWSFRPIENPAAPRVANAAWPRSDLDRFVLQKLEERRLRPVGDADRLTLLRRLSFDLTGLPPTPEEAAAFLADRSPAAVEKLVDRLLESPHFGERWGRHWLDLARYAESNGNVDNVLFPHAWRYRDYVIAALNADKPLDRFITEQLAGDLVPARDAADRNSLLTATGFLALTSKPRAQNNPDYAMDLVAEQIEVTTVALMGVTVACARCHDHKFDPIPQREFYALAAIFESTSMLHGGNGNAANNKAIARAGLHALASDSPDAPSPAARAEQAQALRAEQARLREQIDRLLATARKQAIAAAQAESAAPAVNPNKKQKAKAAEKKLERQLQKVEERLSAEDRKQLQSLRAQLAALDQQVEQANPQQPASGFAMGVADLPKPVEGRIRIRGESRQLGESVPRGFVTVGSHGAPPAVSPHQSGRLELAQWITSRDNPLTARVLANRVWRHLFGRGIVASVDNFGGLGEKPSHPELLDHLATRLVSKQWSLKRLIRYIVTSRTYQLASAFDQASHESDPDNVFYWRHSVRRLDGESLRDAILAASGRLQRTPPQGSPVGGQGAIEVKNGVDRRFAQFEFDHRSVYLPLVRNAEPEFLTTFDLPDTELVVGDRSVTTVPAQSLLLLNSPWMREQSRALAERVLALPAAAPAARLHALHRLALARDARPEELERLSAYLAQQVAGGLSEADAWSRLCQAILASAEFRYVE